MSVSPRFFIVASPRSGTTLLERLLNSHSRIFILPETEFFARLHYYGAAHHEFTVDRARKFLDYYFDTKPARLLGLEKSIHRGLLLLGAGSYADIFNRLLQLLARNSGKDVVGEKTPHHLHFIDYIRDLYPDAPIIALVRDGRAVVKSRMRHPNWENNYITASCYWRDDARRLQQLLLTRQ